MTRDEAEQRAHTLQQEDPERDSYRYFARESKTGEWEVARMRLPQGLRREPLTPTIDSSPKPSPADDPRTGAERRVPGLPGGL